MQAGAYQRASNVSKRISSKNQEGIGSYESWNYVFQNLEKQGYNKDLGERGDVLVNPEDDEDYPEGNTSRGGTLKRSSNEKLKAMKPKSADKVDGIRMPSVRQQQQQQPSQSGAGTKHERENERNESAARASQKTSLVQKLSKTSSNNPDNSQSKANHHTSNPTTSSRRNSITRKVSTTSAKENGNSSSASGGGILVNHSGSNHNNHHHQHASATATSGKKKTASFDTAAATIINPHDGVSEWNCEFCTFLNPDSKRICEMCAKSRNGATTATTSTSNGTATCV